MGLFPEFQVMIVPGLHNSGLGHWRRWGSELIEEGRLGHIQGYLHRLADLAHNSVLAFST